MDFYDSLADVYDMMTDFEARLGNARAFVARLLERHPAARVVDVACGTGLYAMAFAQAGVTHVIGADLSAGMLDAARRRAEGLGLDITWVQAPMQRLAHALDAATAPAAALSPADGIVCLGNSIPHLLTRRDLARTLCGFRKLLAPNGLLALQLLNYERVLKRAERIVEINRAGDLEFVRFYDLPTRPHGTLTFNVLRIEWTPDGPRRTLDATVLRPYPVCELRNALAESGFRDVQTYGGLAFQPYDADTSETVLLLAARQ
ncbi:MAG: Glycine/sarcosine N-methyltransferase [Lentisphaerae bacterium ADurb.BinA184]|nr:MAG: Glycine/sarcosine N-methyltransferase [Lentisphaerae bacterium ADurb.BinA184]